MELAKCSGFLAALLRSVPTAHPDSPAIASGFRRPRRSCGRWSGRLPVREFFIQFLCHRSYRLGGDAAGDDQVKVVEVGVYVEGETMRGDGAGDVDADGGDFGFGRRPLVIGALRAAVLFASESFCSARDARVCRVVQTPVRPQIRAVGMLKSAQVRIRTSSRRRT